jgi:hypothetical protein
MSYPSKEEIVFEQFCDWTHKHWHFKELKAKTGLPDNKLAKWLKRFEQERLIKRIKEENKHPYHIGDYDSPAFQVRKRFHGLQLLQGLFADIIANKHLEVAVLFGSFARGDWYEGSDIDLFIIGDEKHFNRYVHEQAIGREVQTFFCKDRKDFEKFPVKLFKNVVRGIVIKGYLPLDVLTDDKRPKDKRRALY